MNKKIVIVSGGELNEEFTLSVLREEAGCVIGVDRGMEFLYHHQIMPSYIVGDFDSVDQTIATYYRDETDVPIREFNPVKDASDTEIAIRLAMTLGCKEMIILGATGGRIDHLLDPQNRIRLIDGDTVIKKDEAYGPFFSVFPLGAEVYHFNIEGAKYPLTDHTLSPYDSLCVSNQWLEDEVKISFMNGIVILMETKDKGQD